jgi:hypothetical protein
MREPFRYAIRSKAIVEALVAMGFSIYHPAPTYTILEAPSELSARKARKLISLMIACHKAIISREIEYRRYEAIVSKLNTFNGARTCC